MKLYHRNIFWNQKFEIDSRKLLNNCPVLMSKHCRDKKIISLKKLHNEIYKIKTNKKSCEVFEVGYSGKKITKFVVRFNYKKDSDLCVVFAKDLHSKAEFSALTVVTCWLNDKNDKHVTLNCYNYSRS